MKVDTKLNFNVNVVKKNTQTLDIELKSYDKNYHEFEIVFPSIELDDSYEVTVLSVFSKSQRQTLDLAEIKDGKAYYVFDTSLIHQEDTVVNYIYLKQGEVQADVMAFEFFVSLSQIDKSAEITAKSYDKNYDQIIEDFEAQLQDYLLGIEAGGGGTGGVDLTNYATKEFVQGLLDNLEIPNPDLTGYATTEYVDTEIANIPTYQEPDLSAYATKHYVDSQIPEIPEYIAPDLSSYATTEYVDGAIDGIVIPDISHLLPRSEHRDTIYDDTELRQMINEKPNVVFTDEAEFSAITDPDPNTFYVLLKGGI